MEARIAKLNQTIQGWVNYFKLLDMGKYASSLSQQQFPSFGTGGT